MTTVTPASGRASGDDYRRLELRAHSLLADVPLHDVWTTELPRGSGERTVADVRRLISLEGSARGSLAVRTLFGLRALLGRLFGWDAEPEGAAAASYRNRLSAEDRERSLVEPGTPDGPFRTLYVSRTEAIGEIHNRTVHAFSVMALVDEGSRYRFWLGIHVLPTGRLTAWYMRLIDPFRHHIVYPALLRHLRARWGRS
jgi:hypothetical protein